MPDCIECREFTKYNGGLCLKCYNNKKQSVFTDTKQVEVFIHQIDDKNNRGFLNNKEIIVME